MSYSDFKDHPCFDEQAHFKVGRMHLPVAFKCNIQCNYCSRGLGAKENRPGLAKSIWSPQKALEMVREAVAKDETLKVIGIAGPGDPLANEPAFETLTLLHQEFPHLKKCLSTNGLLLPWRIDDLKRAGVSHLSITINAISKEVGKKFYSWLRLEDKIYRRKTAFSVLSDNQLQGLKEAVHNGFRVKVNSVLVPEINRAHLIEVAKMVKSLGASVMNIMPLIPLGRMATLRAPNCLELYEVRSQCEKIINQFRQCKQCRADAIGIPGRVPLSEMLSLTPSYHY